MTSDDSTPAPQKWPASPYKGLSYYLPSDAPLLAGRGEDVAQCVRLAQPSSMRILILHGPTGCGKSSFLRAGLIPLLESPVGFRFLREHAGVDAKALLISSTDDPLGVLAERVCEFVNRGITVNTPIGERTVDLRKALPRDGDDAGAQGCAALLQDSPEKLLAVLQNIAGLVPNTLVLIIDQAEEVLTLQPGPRGDEARNAFFEFLANFTESSFDMKLIVALRTEYYGRFYSKLRGAFADRRKVQEYTLDELTPDQMEEAIVRPTSETPIYNLDPPWQTYQFTYEPGLPGKIVEALTETEVAGGMLPVLQIVCSTLLERARKVKPEGPVQITSTDFKAMGGPAAQVEEHLDRVLFNQARKGLSLDEAFNEVDRWKLVLNRLVRSQPDGTATSDIVKELDLCSECEKYECKVEPKGFLEFLAKDEIRILRPVHVPERKTDNTILCYSLGHDTLGLVLRRWNVVRREEENRIRRERYSSRKWGLIIIVVGLGLMAALTWFHSESRWLALILVFYGGLFLLFGFTRQTIRAVPSRTTAKVMQSAIAMYPRWFAQHLLENKSFSKTFEAYPELRLAASARGTSSGIADAFWSSFPMKWISDLLETVIRLQSRSNKR